MRKGIYFGADDYEAAVAQLFARPPAAPHPVLPRLDAALLKRIVEGLRHGPTRPCRVAGQVNWSDLQVVRELDFRQIEFEGEFVAEVASFTTLRFTNCRFAKGATLRNCRIGGELAFRRCQFGVSRKTGTLILSGTRVEGQIDIRGCTIKGGLAANGVSCLALRSHDVRVGAACEFAALEAKRHVVLTKTRIGGDLTARFLRCAGLVRLESGCAVGGEVDLAGAQIASQLDLADGRFGVIRFNGSAIGSLWMGSSGSVECRGIYAIDSRFASYVRLSRLKVMEPRSAGTDLSPLSDEWGRIFFRHCRFGSQFWAWVWHRDSPNGGWENDNYVQVDKGVSIIDCDIGGELNLTRLKVGRAGDHDAGTVRLDRTVLRGWLFISSPSAVARRVDVPEEVRQSARTCAETNGGAMASDFRARMRSLSLRDLKASGVEISGLSLVRCNRSGPDLDMDGSLLGDRVEVAGTFMTYACLDAPDYRAHAEIAGALRLRGAQIGELRLAGDSFDEPRSAGGRAATCGVVLELADIGLLRVPPRPPCSGREGQPATHHNGFPIPLDLSGLSVRNWNFAEKVDAESESGADTYLDFLDNDETLHREVYRSIAQSLRNAGRDRDAEKILFAEEYRARWETRHARSARKETPSWPEFSRLGRPKGRRGGRLKAFRRAFGFFGRGLEWLDRVFLQYRRNPIALLYAILILFGTSWLSVSSHASNFELSEGSRLVLQNRDAKGDNLALGVDYRIDGRNVGPDPDKWGFTNAFWMTARYHVPIVSMATEDEYVPSNDNRLRFRLPWQPPTSRTPGEDPGEIFFSAEDWFGLMSLLNWIMWPLLLTFALRRALRAD